MLHAPRLAGGALSAGRGVVRLVDLLPGLGLPSRLLEPPIDRHARHAQPPRRRRLGLTIVQQRLRPRWPPRATRPFRPERTQELERPLTVIERQHARPLGVDEQPTYRTLELANVVGPLASRERPHERRM